MVARGGQDRSMASDLARDALYDRLRQVLGPVNADTLMSSLPPGPADRLATKADIDRLELRFDRLDERFDRLEDRFNHLVEQFIALSREMHAETGALHDRMHEQFRNYSFLTIGSMTALTGIFAIVVGLIT